MSFLRFQGEGALCPFPLIVWSGCWVWCCECRRVVRPAVCAGACCASRRCFCAGACSDPPCARCLRAPAAPLALLAVPGGEGLRAPTPGPPTRGKLSLQAFARSRARAALRAGVSLLAHAATRRVRAGGALPPRRSLCSQPPGARGCAPLPPDPYPRQAELAGFCALRARAALRAGVFYAGARCNPPCFVLAHVATRPCVPFSLAFFGLILPLLRGSFIASLTVLFLCFL